MFSLALLLKIRNTSLQVNIILVQENRKIVRSKKIITNGIILSKQVNSIISFSSYIFKLKNKDDLIRRLMDGLAYTIFIGLIIISHTPVPRCCVRNDQITLCVFILTWKIFDILNIFQI